MFPSLKQDAMKVGMDAVQDALSAVETYRKPRSIIKNLFWSQTDYSSYTEGKFFESLKPINANK